ncbi:protease modulator HflC [Candidatus Tenderia electrophaga]|jgi:membrane protease subunit HflC|uniref:Protein HflC n=1 Tax=Candidatus Tenderia electrophaga TaxID=1748243 RepID=A0A0S2TCH9_9GAMM|nr:protease modulator HflC [Candidatus Tenderia electrophaga]
MNQNKSIAIVIVLGFALILGLFSVYTVNERQKAILLRLGEIEKSEIEPGLHFKIPFINNVRKFDSRILTMDAEPETFLTAEKKNVVVDAFVKWQITDAAEFFTSMGGDERLANVRLSQIIKNGLRDEFGKRTIQEVVSGERAEIMDILVTSADKQVEEFGMDVVDLRIKRIDLKGDISEAIYRRMEAERTRVANDLRSLGAEEAERIRADADRQRTVILAEAYREAEQLRGEGDATAAKTYATAFEKDPEFYALYRSLGAYRSSFRSKNDMLVIEPDADFFRYFADPKGTAK